MRATYLKAILSFLLLNSLSSCDVETHSCEVNADCFAGEICQEELCLSLQSLTVPSNNNKNNTPDCGALDCRTCENGQVDAGEECDSKIDLTETCSSLGFAGGKLRCASCRFDTRACEVLKTCQNGTLDSGEICDGPDFSAAQTCQSEGFDGGTLKCSQGCSLDTQACFKCGDAVVNGAEVCDASDFGSKTCQSEVGKVGPLNCSADCKSIDTSECGEGVLQISSGRTHSCLVMSDGTLKCWGSEDKEAHLPPLIGTYQKVVSGDSYSCALETNGKIRCWGRFLNGAKEGEVYDRLAGGNRHVCARIKSDKTTYCWGETSWRKDEAPDLIYTHLSAGGNHSCGIKENKTLECWGNESDIAGVPSDGEFKQITSGGTFACGLLTAGIPLCFGYGGNGLSDRIPGDYIQLAAGGTHVCGLLSNGSVQCWGDLQSEMGHLAPPKGVKFTQLSAGLFFTCGITRAAKVECWGTNTQKQIIVPSF